MTKTNCIWNRKKNVQYRIRIRDGIMMYLHFVEHWQYQCYWTFITNKRKL